MKVCKLCQKEKELTCFSKHSGTKDKLDQRCKDCVKQVKRKAKENAKKNDKKDDYLDRFETDIYSKDWQGGKTVGNIFKRTTQNIDYYVVNVGGKQKSFNISKYKKEEYAKKDAEKYLIEKNKESGIIKNQYKIIHARNGIPEYLIVQLSKDYVMLVDYEDLDKIKKHTLFVSRSAKNRCAKQYAGIASINFRSSYQKFITDYDMTDHINGYPLDNRKKNLRSCNHSENNKNKTCINSINIRQTENNGYIPSISYNNNTKVITTPVEFETKKDAEKWVKSESEKLDKNIEFIEVDTNRVFETNIRCIGIDKKKKIYVPEIEYYDNTEKRKTVGSNFNTLKEADNWIKVNSDKINTKLKDSLRKTLAKEFEAIMEKHADGFRWHDKIKYEDEDNGDDKDDEDKPVIKEVVTEKDNKYNLFLKVDPNFDLSKIDKSEKKIKHIMNKGNEYKFCSGCDTWIDVEKFFSAKKNWDGLDRRCKKCKKNSTKESSKQWRERNKERISEYNKKYRDGEIKT